MRKQVVTLEEIGGGGDRERVSRTLLGAQSVALATLRAAGLPVPTGFAISAAACALFARHDRKLPAAVWEEVSAQVQRIGAAETGRFGWPVRPMLLCLQPDPAASGAPPLPALRNIGLGDRLLEGFAQRTGERRSAWDTYRRLLRQFGTAVCGLPADLFEGERRRILNKYGANEERELDDTQLRELCEHYQRLYFERLGRPFPQDPYEQLRMALRALYARWADTASSATASAVNGHIGMPLLVTVAVFGNLDRHSAVVRAGSRDGRSGVNEPRGEYLVCAQEEDWDRPECRPQPMEQLSQEPSEALRRAGEAILGFLREIERQWRYPQQAAFVVECGTVWITGCGPLPRSGRAAIRWALDLAGRERRSRKAPPADLPGLEGRDIEAFLTDASRETPPLIESLRRGVAEARRHPDYALWHELHQWARGRLPLQLWVEAAGMDDVRLARRLAADGLLICPASRVNRAAAAGASVGSVWRALGAVARGLPLMVELCGREDADDLRRVLGAAVTGGTAPMFILTDPSGANKGLALPVAGGAMTGWTRGMRIATPRAALLADLLAEQCGFLLFDLEPLTRSCHGEIAPTPSPPHPQSLDIEGVGQLLELAANKARSTRHDIRLFVRGLAPCDTAGLRYLQRIRLDGVMTPASQAPVMMVMAAQAG